MLVKYVHARVITYRIHNTRVFCITTFTSMVICMHADSFYKY